MVTHLPDGTSYEMKSPGYMLDRSLFDKELVTSAILSGAKISVETRAIRFSSEGLVVERGSKEEMIQAKVFIGADGVHSFTARCLGQPTPKTIVALQYEVIIQSSKSIILCLGIRHNLKSIIKRGLRRSHPFPQKVFIISDDIRPTIKRITMEQHC
jgi:flavin-dependent dehydrogenase